jgi:uncharacterized membrane protein YeaQ/YmgE (transglycosylase-associated protein family)
MSKRKQITRPLVIGMLVWDIIGAFILYSIETSAIQNTGGNSSSANISPAVIGSILWLIYWIRSKKVKSVFTA